MRKKAKGNARHNKGCDVALLVDIGTGVRLRQQPMLAARVKTALLASDERFL